MPAAEEASTFDEPAKVAGPEAPAAEASRDRVEQPTPQQKAADDAVAAA